MSNEVNVFETTAWEREMGSARGTRVGAAAGAQKLGCTLFEVDPGAQAVPYHLHHSNEEMLIVLDGQLELRTPDATRIVARGDVVAFSRPAQTGRTGCATPPMRQPDTSSSRR